MHPDRVKALAELRGRGLRNQARKRRTPRRRSTRGTRRGTDLLRAGGVFVVILLLLAACSAGVQGYRDFRSAVDSGATCAQLIDINEDNFIGTADQDRVERDLREIGCVTSSSTRTDEE